MNLAGKYLSLAQGVAESALLAPLRSKYRLNLNLMTLAQDAKEELVELGISINPMSLLKKADDLASRQETMLTDVIGTEWVRFDKAGESERYIYPDPRPDFRR